MPDKIQDLTPGTQNTPSAYEQLIASYRGSVADAEGQATLNLLDSVGQALKTDTAALVAKGVQEGVQAQLSQRIAIDAENALLSEIERYSNRDDGYAKIAKDVKHIVEREIMSNEAHKPLLDKFKAGLLTQKDLVPLVKETFDRLSPSASKGGLSGMTSEVVTSPEGGKNVTNGNILTPEDLNVHQYSLAQGIIDEERKFDADKPRSKRRSDDEIEQLAYKRALNHWKEPKYFARGPRSI